jgi:sugar phosphate isomerase/epimerase
MMRTAVSNLAWRPEDEGLVADHLRDLGIAGVELAPTLVWPRPLEATSDDILACRRRWEARGVRVVALQALLFGRPDLELFASPSSRAALSEHLAGMMLLASRLGARVLVLGGPRNRQRHELTPSEAMEVAIPFFRTAGERAHSLGVALCIEPNPARYGCDFVTTSEEGLSLVQQVASDGFGLHLDASAMILAGEDLARALQQTRGHVAHFHASEPDLAALGTCGVDHVRIARLLRDTGYPNWVSLEMRTPSGGTSITALRQSLLLLQSAYGDER